jgi:hypothetical protein
MSPRKRRSKRPHSARFAPALAVDDADCADGADADEEEKNDERDVELEQPDEAPDAPPATAPKRKALRGDAAALWVTAGEARYAPRTHTNSLLNKRGLSFGDPAARYRRARKAAEASWRVVEDEERDVLALFNGTSSRPTAEMASARRHAISYVFESIFGSPPEPKWAGRATDREGGIIAKISLRLAIPPSSSKLVRKVPPGHERVQRRATTTPTPHRAATHQRASQRRGLSPRARAQHTITNGAAARN